MNAAVRRFFHVDIMNFVFLSLLTSALVLALEARVLPFSFGKETLKRGKLV